MKKNMALLKILMSNIIIISLLSEAGTLVLYPHVFQKKFSRKAVRQKLMSRDKYSGYIVIDTNPGADQPAVSTKVLHPYLGFVYNTDAELKQRGSYYGFGGGSLVKRSEDEIHIAVSGGSAAMGLCRHSAHTLIDRLENSAVFEEKKIYIHCLSIDGYKQPQQLMSLNYFLSLGGEFDIWINFDGFNEITLPVYDNWLKNITPVYPRAWNIYARKSVSVEEVDKMVEIKIVRSFRSALKKIFSVPVLSHSAFFLALWEAADMKQQNREYMLNRHLENIFSQKKASYQISGPFPDYKNWHDVLPELTDIWKRSSVQMAKLCKANGIKYYHFIQPNQYHEGSKILNDEERVIAFEEKDTYAYKLLARTGYPLLVEEGKKMKESGIPFHDLTMIFKDEERTVYSDKCCHFNKFGYDTIAGKIADTVISDLR